MVNSLSHNKIFIVNTLIWLQKYGKNARFVRRNAKQFILKEAKLFAEDVIYILKIEL